MTQSIHMRGVERSAPDPLAPADGLARVAELEVEVGHLRKALASRDVIGQAKGVLMERFKLSAEEAFGLLVQASQNRNIRVADLGSELAETGEWVGPTPG
jgi:AmiR/NasT family two-component response regulator